jgi:hypothetical protein
VDELIWDAVRASRGWLDAANGTGDTELTCRILKLTEESGEAAAAWIGVLGQNPRKGVTHRREDVAAELADVVFTALVARSTPDRLNGGIRHPAIAPHRRSGVDHGLLGSVWVTVAQS